MIVTPNKPGELWMHCDTILVMTVEKLETKRGNLDRWSCFVMGRLGEMPVPRYNDFGALWIYEWHPQSALRLLNRV